jgi:phage shock protein E
MEKLFTILIAFALVTSCNGQKNKKQTVNNTEMTAEQLMDEVNKGEALILDVRTLGEYNSGHVKGAINIDVMAHDFSPKAEKLDKAKKVYLYCRSGGRSSNATSILKGMGFGNATNIGGIDGLADAGFPIEQ